MALLGTIIATSVGMLGISVLFGWEVGLWVVAAVVLGCVFRGLYLLHTIQRMLLDAGYQKDRKVKVDAVQQYIDERNKLFSTED